MVCTLEAKQAAAQAQMTSCGLKKQPFVKNTFKCSRCMRVYHASGSPLVLCDYCPKAFHVSCLDVVAMCDLPALEWACPKCHEKQAANKQKLEDLAVKKKEALERVATVRSRTALLLMWRSESLPSTLPFCTAASPFNTVFMKEHPGYIYYTHASSGDVHP